MLLIDCPHCGPRAQEEFTYERTMDSVVRIADDAETALAALYTRANPRGEDDEIWRHTLGCRSWMVLRRDRTSHVIQVVRPLGPEALP